MTLSEGEKAAFYDYICKYANDIDKHEGEFHLENQDVQAFLSKNDIYIVEGLDDNRRQAETHSQYVIWKKNQNKKDHAYMVLKHIRNSMAHAHLKKNEENFYVLEDQSGKKGQTTMEGKIKIDLLNNLLELLRNSRTVNK